MRLQHVWNQLSSTARYSLSVAVLISLIGRDTNFGLDIVSRARRFVRGEEFNFVTWTLSAVETKLGQSSLGEQAYMSEADRRERVLRFFEMQDRIQGIESRISELYVQHSTADAERLAGPLRQELDALRAQQADEQPLAEAIFQDQLAETLGELGLTFAGVPVPPVAFHFTPLPLMLVISPRSVIRQEANIDLRPGFSVDDREALETQIDRSLDVSSYVTPIGGIGTYPTMLAETSALNWAAEVGAHEWIHNYLTLRPLGLSYGDGPEMRTINETVAVIAGKEIGQALIERFYPDKVPPPTAEAKAAPGSAAPAPPSFDFRAEMHETRVRVDQLLSEGKVEEAERYMEERRQIFVRQGYSIRKLNQAYFAFFGAYADSAGATGSDPVGPLVVEFRHRSPSLAAFLNRVGWMNSFEQLQKAIGG